MELRHRYDLAILLRCLRMARSNFYYYQKQLQGIDKYEETKTLIKQFYHKHKGRYGYRRITLLLRERGLLIPQNRLPADAVFKTKEHYPGKEV
jgi:putative transposase